jgi:putative acetyltransferase
MTYTPPDYRIVEDDLWEPEIIELLELHLDDLRGISPPDSVHAMTIERLREPDVTFFTAWDDEELAACGALKELDKTHGEIKSMRAAPAYRGKGAGKAILEHIIAEARERGYTRLSLETGRTDPFKAAARLYVNHGFQPCPAFADYVLDDFSICLSREL